MAVRELKLIAGKTPQPIKVTPDDSLHRNASLVHIELADVAGRALILFDITGDGTVQMLYPSGSDPYMLQTADLQFSGACPKAVWQRPTNRCNIPTAHDCARASP